MHKKILIGSGLGLAMLLAAGVFVLQAGAQVFPAASCGSLPGTCLIGTSGAVTVSGNTSNWGCIAGTGSPTSVSCSYTVPQANGGVCSQTVPYTCVVGTPAYTGYQPGDNPGTNYYDWGCQIVSGGITNCQILVTSSTVASVTAAAGGSTIPTQGPICSANDNCNTIQGQVCVSPGSQAAYCGLPNGPSGSTITGVLTAGGNTAYCTGYPGAVLSDAQNCNAVFTAQAQILGYTSACTISTNTDVPAGIAPLIDSHCILNGNGLLGPQSNTSWDPEIIVGQTSGQLQGWAQIENPSEQAAAGGTSTASPTTTGSGTTTTTTGTGTTPAGTQTTTSVTTTQTGTTPASVSAVNSTLASALNEFSSVLNSVNAGAAGAGSTAPTITGSSAGGTSATGSTSSASCASAAESTITSSAQTLQGLETILASSNTSAGVLTSIQNLINAVAQVISALSGCISS